ncbi:hypothetical protein HanXRQr2_Chr03g0131421 [Helianthus annuus]|uniref:Uncharacterized protein n=1 Tax=Helianthus annuus TaxID=4232 RepID=A0A251VC30_HELAN|nr:hypothetical protein HanXRQr2_Chr03g0131421 [Helianthus annuus]KAJ0945444.1 hypothetical protein HanPSC8_Chr03g0128231 [Helianthus annuus]
MARCVFYLWVRPSLLTVKNFIIFELLSVPKYTTGTTSSTYLLESRKKARVVPGRKQTTTKVSSFTYEMLLVA